MTNQQVAKLDQIMNSIDEAHPEFSDIPPLIKRLMTTYFFGRIVAEDGSLKPLNMEEAHKLASDLKHDRATMTVEQRLIRALYRGALESYSAQKRGPMY